MHFIHLRVRPGDHAHTRSDSGAIAFRPNQFQLDPILQIAAVVAQQGRDVIHIQNQRIDVPVIVIISESRAPTGESLADSGPHFCGNILELAFAQILVYEARILECLTDVVAVNFGIDVPVDLHNIRPTVIVVIQKSAAPRHVLVVDPHAGRERHVAEGSVAVVVIQVAGVVGKISLENVEPSVAIVIGHADAHARLLVAIFAVRHAGNHRHIRECAVMIVSE